MVVTQDFGVRSEAGNVAMRYVPGNRFASPDGTGHFKSLQAKVSFHFLDSAWQSSLVSLRDAIVRFRPDVAHTNNLQGLGYRTWQLLAELNLPTLVTMHDYSLSCLNQSRFRGAAPCAQTHLACALTGWLKQRWLKKLPVVGISAPSHFLLGQEAAHLPEHARFRRQWHLPLPLPPAELRSGTRPPRLRLGFMGRLVRAKGAHLLVAIGDALGGQFEMEIAGGGELAKNLADAASTRKWLSFKGFVPRFELADFFGRIDVLLVPSQWAEIYSLVIREAMHFGVPSLVSNRGALPELVASGEGKFVESDDATTWSDAIRSIAADPAALGRLSANCRATAQKLDYTSCVDQYVAMLAELMGEGTQC